MISFILTPVQISSAFTLFGCWFCDDVASVLYMEGECHALPVREGGEPTGVEGLEGKLLFVWSGE